MPQRKNRRRRILRLLRRSGSYPVVFTGAPQRRNAGVAAGPRNGRWPPRPSVGRREADISGSGAGREAASATPPPHWSLGRSLGLRLGQAAGLGRRLGLHRRLGRGFLRGRTAGLGG